MKNIEEETIARLKGLNQAAPIGHGYDTTSWHAIWAFLTQNSPELAGKEELQDGARINAELALRLRDDLEELLDDGEAEVYFHKFAGDFAFSMPMDEEPFCVTVPKAHLKWAESLVGFLGFLGACGGFEIRFDVSDTSAEGGGVDSSTK